MALTLGFHDGEVAATSWRAAAALAKPVPTKPDQPKLL